MHHLQICKNHNNTIKYHEKATHEIKSLTKKKISLGRIKINIKIQATKPIKDQHD